MMEPNVAVLIPSHIGYEGQIDLLDNCILSLMEQSLKPKSIYISISFENETYKSGFKRLLEKYGRRMKPKVSFKISSEKKYQMEHLHNIANAIDLNDYDMLMFCDDDDTYHHQRLDTFVDVFKYGKNANVKNFGGVREHVDLRDDDDPRKEIPEYWCYGIVPNAIVDFFSFFKGEHYILLKQDLSDMYFRLYLRKNSKYYAWMGIIDKNIGFTLYNYNINNPNSICGKIERGMRGFETNLIMEVFYANSDRELDSVLEKYKDKYSIDESYELSAKMIYNFCKVLCE